MTQAAGGVRSVLLVPGLAAPSSRMVDDLANGSFLKKAATRSYFLSSGALLASAKMPVGSEGSVTLRGDDHGGSVASAGFVAAIVDAAWRRGGGSRGSGGAGAVGTVAVTHREGLLEALLLANPDTSKKTPIPYCQAILFKLTRSGAKEGLRQIHVGGSRP